MSLTFLAPGETSEDIIDAEIVSDEVAPSVPDEPITERARKVFAKVPCPICGDLMAAHRLNVHARAKHGSEAPATASAPQKPASERKPKAPPTRRIKADDLLTMLVGGAGTLVGNFSSRPTGIALQLEAPLLGPALDKAVAGTPIDKMVVQPIVRTKGKFEDVAPLVLLPGLVFMLDKNPAMTPQLLPMLRMTMSQMLPGLVAAVKRQAVENEKMRQAASELADLDPAFAEMFAGGGDPIDALIGVMFAVASEEPIVVEEPGSAWEPAQ